MPTPRRLLLLVLPVLALTACGVTEPATAREADQHAEVASTVMTRGGYPVSANDAAWTVVGEDGDTTIEAMAVEGTAWDGTVTLRISVTDEGGGWVSGRPTVRCYRFTFDHDAGNGATAYDVVDCPAGPPIVLTEPPHPDLSTTGATALATTLTALDPAHRSAADVQRVLTAAYPPPVATTAHDDPAGVRFGVGWTGSCMTGTVPPTGPATVTPQADLTCRGG